MIACRGPLWSALPAGWPPGRQFPKEGAKPRLFEMAVGGEGIVDTAILHYDEADAIGEAPVLVEALVTQFERPTEQIGAHRHHIE